ncbi:mst89B [Musca autumnalis]|uniref:mst89B n=1 Tax=Musca autumnalis TaxID=221902 RepID=UPI003CEC5828
MYPPPPPPSTKKIVHISEETLAPTFVHFVVDNEPFIAIQQDMRRIEDVRLISFQKLNQNGYPIAIEPMMAEYLYQLLQKGCAKIISSSTKPCDIYPQPMDVSSGGGGGGRCSIEEQLKWDRCNNNSARQVPFPFTYSRGTSTADLNVCVEKQPPSQCLKSKPTVCPKKVSFSCATQTQESMMMTSPHSRCQDAREQRRHKKLAASYFS